MLTSLRFTLLLMLLLSSLLCMSQIITTVAGNGGTGSSGDGGLAVLASLNVPYGGVFDIHQSYYFVEATSNRVRKISAGVITTIIGDGIAGYSGDGGIASVARVSSPQWVTTDISGNIYISDAGNKRIRKIGITGNVSTVAGNGFGAYNGDGIPATNAAINPSGICVDAVGNIYIADAGRVRKVNLAGIISTIAGTGTVGFSGDGGLATAAQIHAHGVYFHLGELFIADFNRVRKINQANNIINSVAGTGLGLYNGDSIPATSANFASTALAWDMHNNLYIADLGNNRVRKVDMLGTIYTEVGNGTSGYSGDGGLAINASVSGPSGIAFDTCNNLYVTCKNNYRIRKVTFNPPPCTYLSVDEQTVKKEVSIYPNPANDELHINTSPGISQGEVVLCNMLGLVVLMEQVNSKQTTLNIKHLPPGLYMLALTDEDGKRTVHKIVKE